MNKLSEHKQANAPLITGVVGLSAGIGLQCYHFQRLPEMYYMKWLCDLDEEKVKNARTRPGPQI